MASFTYGPMDWSQLEPPCFLDRPFLPVARSPALGHAPETSEADLQAKSSSSTAERGLRGRQQRLRGPNLLLQTSKVGRTEACRFYFFLGGVGVDGFEFMPKMGKPCDGYDT